MSGLTIKNQRRRILRLQRWYCLPKTHMKPLQSLSLSVGSDADRQYIPPGADWRPTGLAFSTVTRQVTRRSLVLPLQPGSLPGWDEWKTALPSPRWSIQNAVVLAKPVWMLVNMVHPVWYMCMVAIPHGLTQQSALAAVHAQLSVLLVPSQQDVQRIYKFTQCSAQF
jgi:hypothetical protein